jgi:hypothetical protein
MVSSAPDPAGQQQNGGNEQLREARAIFIEPLLRTMFVRQLIERAMRAEIARDRLP